MADKLMLGLPKGSLEQATTDMFRNQISGTVQ